MAMVRTRTSSVELQCTLAPRGFCSHLQTPASLNSSVITPKPQNPTCASLATQGRRMILSDHCPGVRRRGCRHLEILGPVRLLASKLLNPHGALKPEHRHLDSSKNTVLPSIVQGVLYQEMEDGIVHPVVCAQLIYFRAAGQTHRPANVVGSCMPLFVLPSRAPRTFPRTNLKPECRRHKP